MGVNIVPDLFSLVAKNLVFPAFQIAFHQIGQKTVQLDP